MKLTSSKNILTNPIALQRLEGLALFAAGIYAWLFLGGVWWLFLVLLLVPDISMLGYLVNPKLGAAFYNLVHSYPLAILCLAAGVGLTMPALTFAGVILLGHIGWDRMLGYGLKFDSGFKDTHLSNL